MVYAMRLIPACAYNLASASPQYTIMSILKIYRGQALQKTLDEIIQPVQVTYLAIDQPEPDILTAMADLKTLTPHLSFTIKPGSTLDADQVLVQGVQASPLVFVGAPLGTELASLVSAIVVAGRGQSGLLPETRQALVELTEPVQLEVFTTPT